jgi:hypothetical protein
VKAEIFGADSNTVAKKNIFLQKQREKDRRMARRVKLWIALADLFLDTVLDEGDFRHIAAGVLKSEFTADEVHDILWYEVFPELQANLRHPFGEWAGFSDKWLERNLRVAEVPPSTPPDPEDHITKEIRRCWIEVCRFLPPEFNKT